jgi:hypothetical protein
VSDADPTWLARRLHDAASDLARCLTTDVRIEPVHVIVPLLQTMDQLVQIAGELGRAAISVDEPAAHAAYRAADQFTGARKELTEAVVRLRDATRTPPGPHRPPRRRPGSSA